MNRIKEIIDIVNNIDLNFFLVDYPFQKEVYDIGCVDNMDDCALDVRIRTQFKCSNETEILFLQVNYDTLECYTVYESSYHHNRIKEDAWKCASKLENLLKKVIIEGKYIKINNKYV